MGSPSHLTEPVPSAMTPCVLFNRKDGHALLADRLYQCHWHLCTGLFSPGVATCQSAPRRCRPCSGETDGDGDSPDSGTQCRVGLSDVSSCPESRRLVASDRQSTAAEVLSGRIQPVGCRR